MLTDKCSNLSVVIQVADYHPERASVPAVGYEQSCAVMLVYPITFVHLSVPSSGLRSLEGSFTPVGSTTVCEGSGSYLRALGIFSVLKVCVFHVALFPL